MSSKNNKRIAKNTLMLYMRMLITMAISLYTSRIVLNTLGVEDWGIYNVVGGFVTILGFLNSSMASSTYRFLSFEIGKRDLTQFTRIFSMSVNIHFIIALIILMLSETVGLWFINTQLIIPAERMVAANWVYQFSILAFMVNVVSVPYNAVIIAHEKMNVFAWISIVEVSLKLFIVFMLQLFGFDKLKLYAIMMFGIELIIRIIYGLYCRSNFTECKYSFFWQKPLFKTLTSYASWNLWGHVAGVTYDQGLNVLLNIFFGPAVNAARGIAYQAQGAINGFTQNFQMAMNPQIIKSFASNDLEYMHLLISRGAKYSFFLLFALSLPILLETENILKLWLKIVPEYTVIFTQLVIINALINSISGPLMTAAQASGRIKLYQGMVGGLLLLILPISYLFLKLGFSPQVTLYISISFSIIAFFTRLIIVRNLVHIKVRDFLLNVLLKAVTVCFVAIILPISICLIIEKSLYSVIIVGLTSIISTMGTIYIIGLNKNEKDYFLQTVKKTGQKLFKK